MIDNAQPSRLPPLVVSIVSHGHDELVGKLLHQMASRCGSSVSRVVLTQNLPGEGPKAPAGGWPFELHIITNSSPKGFGANHNAALLGASEDFVCVLNPDVDVGREDPFPALLHACAAAGVGCAYPVQLDAAGQVQSSEREIPTPLALLRRRVLGRTDVRVDWVNAACIVVPASTWASLGGFDERYFMYCEDVDLCLRMRLQGLSLVKAPVSVLHAGQRASSRSVRHLAWHVRSLLRLWSSPVYARAQQLSRRDGDGRGTIGTP